MVTLVHRLCLTAVLIALTSCLSSPRGQKTFLAKTPPIVAGTPTPGPAPEPNPISQPAPKGQAPVLFVPTPEALSFLRAAFPQASLASRHKIADPITEGAVNTTYLRVYDGNGMPLGYARDISTTTGCKGLCRPLEFTLTLRNDLSFQKILSWSPLTKYGHQEFTEEDYAKLESLMIQSPKSLGTVTSPMDLVDGTTKATRPEYQGDVVPTAAFSTLRIYVYKRQTQDYLATHAPENAEPPTPEETPTPAPAPVPVPVPVPVPTPAPAPIVTLPPAPAVPGAIPALEFQLPDRSGKVVDFSYSTADSAFRGKVSVLVFFATWCPHCQKELPAVQRVVDRLASRSDVEILAISTFYRAPDYEKGTDVVLENFVKKYQVPRIRILSDSARTGRVGDRYKVTGIPLVFIIDKWGRIRHVLGREVVVDVEKDIPNLVSSLLQE